MKFIQVVYSLYYMHMITTDERWHIIMMTCRCSRFLYHALQYNCVTLTNKMQFFG